MDSAACAIMTGHCHSGRVVRLRTTVSLTYRGQLLEVEIGLDNVEYALREGNALTIRHETEQIHLTPENPVVTRPVSKR